MSMCSLSPFLANDFKTCWPAEQKAVIRASLTEWKESKSAGLHWCECTFLKAKGGKTTREHSGAIKRI